LNRKIKILLNYFLGPVLFVVLSYSLYHQIINQANVYSRWQQILGCYKSWPCITVLFLMLVNWGIETKKWQLLITHLQPINFLTAFKSVLSGCSVTMLTPNRIGEYGGRILYIQPQNRIKAISLTIVGSISQLLVTMAMGCIGLIFLRIISQSGSNVLPFLPHFWGNVLIYLSVSVTVLIFLFYWRISWLVKMLEKVPAFNKFTKHISVLDEFTNKQLMHILFLSFVRYLVFVLQYVLLLQALQVHIPFITCYWLIAVFYLVMAVAPTIGFIELPLRIGALCTILQYFSNNELAISSAALGIWLINLVLPAVIGSLLILSIKIVKDNNE
jgi:Lysylphosphatidylglycerol synthase TM region